MNTGAISPMQIGDLDIVAVWEALGGGALRFNRGRAFWRNGDGLNIAIDRGKGCWYDQVNHCGGGILALVETVIGGRREALQWLDHNFGIGGNRTIEEQRAYARKMAAARAAAAALIRRRDDYLYDLRDASIMLLQRYHALLRESEEKHDFELAVQAEGCFNLLDKNAEQRDFLTEATGPQLLAWFAQFESEAA